MATSCCVPVVFAPVQIEGRFYVDGGILSNFPVSAIREECETLIGVSVSPVITAEYLPTVKYVIERTMNYTIGANTVGEKRKCDYLIESSDFGAYSMFELESADAIYNLGYKLATSYLDENREKLEQDLTWSPTKKAFYKFYEQVNSKVSSL